MFGVVCLTVQPGLRGRFHPFGNQFFTGLANVLTVADGACEDTRDVQAVAQRGVRTITDRQITIQVDAGRECSKSIHLDGAAGAVEFDDLVAEFLNGLIDGTFHQTCGTRSGF